MPIVPNYIEEVFSTFLYTGAGTTQTINNGIDLTGKGGLVWIKRRNLTGNHELFDTDRGNTVALSTNLPNGNDSGWSTYFNFRSTGFGLGPNSFPTLNDTGSTYASWTFRQQEKFFDVVTFTSSASGNKTFNHNLGSVPGCVFIKNTQTSDPWIVYHRSVGNNAYLSLDSTALPSPLTGAFSATSTTFTINSALMYNSQTYVAYVFAHDAGGFGLTNTDNVISCGSVVNTGNPQVTLGYEPQWVLFKSSTSTTAWYIVDNMRGLPVGADQAVLIPNTAVAEVTNSNYININATGFTTNSSLIADQTLIYIAIRRGPMKVPTTGTSVFIPVNGVTVTGNGTPWPSPNFPPDSLLMAARSSTENRHWFDKLRGREQLQPNVTDAETGYTSSFWTQDGFGINSASSGWVGYIGWNFGRAPKFFDQVCYTGTGVARTINHSLTAVPEMMIVRQRNGAANWEVYHKDLSAFGTEPADDSRINLNTTNAATVNNQIWNSTNPTSTVFSVGASSDSNANGGTFINYLFATCPGVSKVGSYTGNGSTQTIDCGFTGGARFVLIRRTDDANNWNVWDTARGMVSGTDPRLALNLSSAEVNNDWVYTVSTGFQLVNSSAQINASGGTYIFLAIA